MPNNKGKGKGKVQGRNTLFTAGRVVGAGAAGAAAVSPTGMFPSQNFTFPQLFADHIPIPSWLLLLMAGFFLGYLACLVVRFCNNRRRAQGAPEELPGEPADEREEIHGEVTGNNDDDDEEYGNDHASVLQHSWADGIDTGYLPGIYPPDDGLPSSYGLNHLDDYMG